MCLQIDLITYMPELTTLQPALPPGGAHDVQPAPPAGGVVRRPPAGHWAVWARGHGQTGVCGQGGPARVHEDQW